MSSYLSLVVKELRANQFVFLLLVGIVAILSVLELYVGLKYQSGAVFGLSFAILMLHLFLLPIFILITLRSEWKASTAHFWLNLPHSGLKLLSAKYVVGIIYSLFFMTIASIMLIVLASYDLKPNIGEEKYRILLQFLQANGASFFIYFLFTSLFLGSLAGFIFMVAKSVRRIGWVIGIIVVGVFLWLWSKFTETKLYSFIAQWGAVEIKGLDHLFTVGEGTTVDIKASASAFYLGELILLFIGAIFVIYLASWLLDHKAEL